MHPPAHVAPHVDALLIQHDELFRCLDWQLPQQDLIDQREDRRVCTDAKGKGDDRDDGKKRAATEPAQGEPQVGNCGGHRLLGRNRAGEGWQPTRFVGLRTDMLCGECYFALMTVGSLARSLTPADVERMLSPTYPGDIRRDSARLRATSARLLSRASELRERSSRLCSRVDPLNAARGQAACFASPANAHRMDPELQRT